jgi:hypothetical protein
MSRLLENWLKSVNPRGYQGGQGWLWWALTDLCETTRGNQLIKPISTGKYPGWTGIVGTIIRGVVALIIVKLLVEPSNPLECGDLTSKGLCEPWMFLAKNLSRRVLPLLV